MSSLSTMLAAVNTAAAGVTGLSSGRVKQGRKWYAESATPLESLVGALTAESQGYFFYWLGPRTIGDRIGSPGTATCYGMLFFKLDKDADSAMDSAYELAERLAKALSDPATFLASKVVEITYECGEEDRENSIAVFDFQMTYQVTAC